METHFSAGRLLGAAEMVEEHPDQVDPAALAKLMREVAATMLEWADAQ